MRILTGVKRPYAWGSIRAIQALIGEDQGHPLAELWFSTHPQAPSPQRPLDFYASGRQGTRCSEDRIALPFMAKILAIDSALSIQVHPDDATSARYFQCGDSRSASITSPLGKAETLLAIERTELVAGPAAPSQVEALVPEAIRGTYPHVWSVDPKRAFGELVQRVGQSGPSQLEQFQRRLRAAPDAVAPELIEHLQRVSGHHPGDRHVMTLAAMRYHVAEPGESVHIRPGVAHSYLSGMGLEITSPSENIARLGLTDKPTCAQLFIECLGNEAVSFGDGCCVPSVTLQVSGLSQPHGPRQPEKDLPIAVKGSENQLLIPFRKQAAVTAVGQEIKPGEALFIPAGNDTYEVAKRGAVATIRWAQASHGDYPAGPEHDLLDTFQCRGESQWAQAGS